jgi:predicted permease
MIALALGEGLGLASTARADAGGMSGRLRAASHGARAHGWQRAQRWLVVTQVASAMALLFAAALIGQSLWRLGHVDIGFRARSALTFDVSLPHPPYPEFENGAAFDLSLMRAVAGLPGVQAVTTAMTLPFDADSAGFRRRFVTDGEATAREATARPNVVPPNYFQTMGIPIRAGRSFAAGDLSAEEPGVVISASLSRELFGRDDAVGRTVRIVDSNNFPVYRVVGVAGDVFGERIQDGVMPTFYFPLLGEAAPRMPGHGQQRGAPRIPYNPSDMRFVVCSDLPASALAPAIRRIIATLDPKVPMMSVSSLGEIAARASAQTRLMMVLLSVAASAALVLCAIGVYSVIAYAVAGRTREFGVRLALGATPSGIVASVMRDSAGLVGAGLAGGALISLTGSALIRAVLFQVTPANPTAYGAAMMVVVMVSAVAAYAPARAAGRTDPTTALRSE